MAAGGFGPPAGDGGCKTPPSPLPPGDPDGTHSQRMSLFRRCITQMLLDQRVRALAGLKIGAGIQMTPSGGGSAQQVAPPDGRGGWEPPTTPQSQRMSLFRRCITQMLLDQRVRALAGLKVGEKIIYSAPKAVVEISEAAGAKTPTRTAAICSLNALWEATDIPLGSTPATGDAVLGSQNALQTHDLNQTPPEPELSADISMPSTCVRDHFQALQMTSAPMLP